MFGEFGPNVKGDTDDYQIIVMHPELEATLTNIKKACAFTFNETDTPEQQALMVAEKMEEALADPRYGDTLKEELESLISVITASTLKVYDVINNEIIPEVSSYSRDIHAAVKEESSKNPLFTSDDVQLSESFEEFNWEELEIVGSRRAIIDYAVKNWNVSDDSVTLGRAKQAQVKLPLRNGSSFVDIKFEDLKREHVLAHYENAISDSIDQDDLYDFFKMLLSAGSMNRLANILNYTRFEKDNKSQVIESAEAIRRYYDVCELIIKAEPMSLSDETREKLNNNAKLMIEYFRYGAYVMLILRETIFKRSILISDKLINMDLKEEFDNAGCETRDLSILLYLTSPNPNTTNGYSLDNLKVNYRQYRDTINKQIQTKRFDRDAYLSECYRRNYKKIMSVAVEDASFDSVYKNPAHRIQEVDKYSRQIGRQSIEDILYSLLIHLHHKNTMVEVMYQRMAKTLLDICKNKSDVNEEDIRLANHNAIASLVSEYLFRFVEVK